MEPDFRSPATLLLKKGDRVRHPDYGTATILKTVKKTGATWIKLDSDGFEGTCCAEILLRE
jgi:hypothetical protein